MPAHCCGEPPRRGPGRRAVVAAAIGAGVPAWVGCSKGEGGAPPRQSGAQPALPSSSSSTPDRPRGEPIGDGSTTKGLTQPHQPTPRKLEPGEPPPQFVVYSWDGAAEGELKLLSRFTSVAKEVDAAMTLFLTGLYALPEKHSRSYRPPDRGAGASDIPFPSLRTARATIRRIGEAWWDGHEIGTHFNGHFCGETGVQTWSVEDWHHEIQEAKRLVTTWRSLPDLADLPSLPFDLDEELIGGRTPCLEGADNLQRAARDLGWRYDTSKTGRQVWPTKEQGLWQVHLQLIPFPAYDTEVLSMDYNLMYLQSKDPDGPRRHHRRWRKEAEAAYLAGFERAYESNRAPLYIGNHFEDWNGGIYMDAVESSMREMARRGDDVRLVSYRQLVDWLDAQDPDVLTKLQRLDVGQAPDGGWASYLAD